MLHAWSRRWLRANGGLWLEGVDRSLAGSAAAAARQAARLRGLACSPRCEKVVDVVVEIPHFAPTPLAPCDLVGSESPRDTCGQNRTPTAVCGTWASLGQACRSGENYLLQGKLGRSIYYAHLTDSPARRSPEQKN